MVKAKKRKTFSLCMEDVRVEAYWRGRCNVTLLGKDNKVVKILDPMPHDIRRIVTCLIEWLEKGKSDVVQPFDQAISDIKSRLSRTRN